MADIPELEFSFAVPADTIGKADKKLRIVADEAARGALARRFDLIAIDSFVTEVTISRIANSVLLRVSGSFRADIVQACVVSHEPVATSISETISERLGPQGHGEAEAIFEFDDEYPPVPFSDGLIELGELLAQNLAVLIDPYPRATDAVPSSVIENEDTVVERQGIRPFESLAILKKNPP